MEGALALWTARQSIHTVAMTLGDERFLSLATFRRNGEPVPTPVWIVPVSGGRLGFYTTMGTGKTKRLKRDPRVTMQPCGRRGEVAPGTAVTEGTAVMVQSGPDFDAVQRDVKANYGWEWHLMHWVVGPLATRRQKLNYADTVVIITPQP